MKKIIGMIISVIYFVTSFLVTFLFSLLLPLFLNALSTFAIFWLVLRYTDYQIVIEKLSNNDNCIKTCGDLMCDLNGRPITGSVKKSAGSYTLESFYTNGIKERADVYEKGTLSSKIYCANKKAEKHLVFHPDGKLGQEAYFKNGKTEGKVYDKNGNLRAVASFNEKADGIIKIFAYPDLTVCELPFINGKLDGVLKATWMCPIDFSLELGEEVEIVFQNEKPISGYKYNTFLPHEKTELTNVHLYNIQQKITSVHSGSEYFSKLLPTYIYEMNEVCKE